MLPNIRCRPTVALNFRSLFQVVCCEKEKVVLFVTWTWEPHLRFWTPIMTWLWLSLVRMRVPIPEENMNLLRRNGRRSTGIWRHFVKGVQFQIFLISERLHKHWLSHREPDVAFSHHVMASSPQDRPKYSVHSMSVIDSWGSEYNHPFIWLCWSSLDQSGFGCRLWLSEVQRQVKEQAAWLIDSARTARVVAG